jgi:hypothetical protein
MQVKSRNKILGNKKQSTGRILHQESSSGGRREVGRIYYLFELVKAENSAVK